MRYLAIVLCTAAVGCSTAAKREAAFDESLKSWFGRSITEYVAENGNPTRSLELPGGIRSYEWQHYGDVETTVGPAYGGFRHVSSEQKSCRITLLTEVTGRIREASYEGHCY